MRNLGGIPGMPTPTGTSGPAGGVDAGGAPTGVTAADAPGGTSFAGFFDAVVAGAAEQAGPATDALPTAGASSPGPGVTPAVILALLGQDVPLAPGIAAPASGLRARMFRTNDGLDPEAVVQAQAGADGDDQAIDCEALSVGAVPPPERQVVPPAPPADSGQRLAAAPGGQMAAETAVFVGPNAATAAFHPHGTTARDARAVPGQTVQAAGRDLTAPGIPGGERDAMEDRTVPERAALIAQPRAAAIPPAAGPAGAVALPASASIGDGPAEPGLSTMTRQATPGVAVPPLTTGAAEPPSQPDGNSTRPQDAARVAGPAQAAAMRTPEASTGEGEADGATPGDAALEGLVAGGGRPSFDAEHGADEGRDGSRGDGAGARLISVGPQAIAPAAHAPVGQPATAAEPQPVPSRLTPELGGPVTSQIVQSLRTQLRGGIGEAVVRLKPEFLGEVTITVRLDRGQVDASVRAALPAVREWLEAQEPAVRQSLGEQGLSLTRLRVEPDGERAFSEDGRQEQPSSNGRHARPRQPQQSEERFELLA